MAWVTEELLNALFEQSHQNLMFNLHGPSFKAEPEPGAPVRVSCARATLGSAPEAALQFAETKPCEPEQAVCASATSYGAAQPSKP